MGRISGTEVIDRISDPSLRRLFDYWQDKRGTNRFPSRNDICPFEMSYLLGSIFLVDIEGDSPKFRYRLFGTKLVARANYELTGKHVEDIPAPDMREVMRQGYHDLVRLKASVVIRDSHFLDGQLQPFEVLLLPMASDHNLVDLILGALVYEN